MCDTIIDGTFIDTSLLAYTAIKAHAAGGKVVNLNDSRSKSALTIASPLMLTWGAQEGKDTAGNPTGKYSLSIQFPNAEYATPEASAFLEQMHKLLHQVKLDAIRNSRAWFGKDISSMDVIDEKFNAMFRYPKKEKGGVEQDFSKPPTMSAKLPQWKGVWKSEIYNEDGEPLFVAGKVNDHLSPLDFLPKYAHAICLLQCGGLWFVNGKVSVVWNLKQAIVQKPKAVVEEGTCFLKPRDSERAAMKALPAPAGDDRDEAEGPGLVLVEDSDEEADADDEGAAQALAQAAQAQALALAQAQAAQAAQALAQAAQAAQDQAGGGAQEEVKPKKTIVRKKVA